MKIVCDANIRTHGHGHTRTHQLNTDRHTHWLAETHTQAKQNFELKIRKFLEKICQKK